MIYEIKSGLPIGEHRYKMIRDILKYSQCPFESFIISVPGFQSFKDGVIQLEDGDTFTEIVDVIRL